MVFYTVFGAKIPTSLISRATLLIGSLAVWRGKADSWGKLRNKDIQIILRLLLFSHCYVLSSQFKPVFSITQPVRSFSVLAGWEGSLYMQ